MKGLFGIGAAALLLAQSAYADVPREQDLLAPLDRFIAAFNRWDAKLPEDVFTNDCTILDIFPPFEWSGPGAPQRWWDELGGADPSSHERKAALHQHVLRGSPEAVASSASEATFNVPAVLTYVHNGASHEIRGRWIIIEKRTAAGWRISAHAWATLASK